MLAQIPSNLILSRVGAHIWLPTITLLWGVIGAACASISGPTSFYLLRLALGIAEAGAFPGMWYVCAQVRPAAFLLGSKSCGQASMVKVMWSLSCGQRHACSYTCGKTCNYACDMFACRCTCCLATVLPHTHRLLSCPTLILRLDVLAVPVPCHALVSSSHAMLLKCRSVAFYGAVLSS